MSEVYEQIEVTIDSTKPLPDQLWRIIPLLQEQKILARGKLRKVILIFERPVGRAGHSDK
jgi:hypothetical protein